MKRCTVCGVDQPDDHFYRNPKVKGGRLNQCIPCVRKAQRARNALLRQDPVKCAQLAAAKRTRYERRVYGVTRQELMEKQGGRCAICERDLTQLAGHKVVIDHCHATGAVRGVLCHSCNVALGRFRDDPDTVERAALYLRAGVNG